MTCLFKMLNVKVVTFVQEISKCVLLLLSKFRRVNVIHQFRNETKWWRGQNFDRAHTNMHIAHSVKGQHKYAQSIYIYCNCTWRRWWHPLKPDGRVEHRPLDKCTKKVIIETDCDEHYKPPPPIVASRIYHPTKIVGLNWDQNYWSYYFARVTVWSKCCFEKGVKLKTRMNSTFLKDHSIS